MSKTKEYYASCNEAEFEELEETKAIVRDLLRDLTFNTMKDFLGRTKTLISDLNTDTGDVLIHTNKHSLSKAFYAVHFEAINLNVSNVQLADATIYIGLGIDLEMQKTVLGFWLKQEQENGYQFWLRVCGQLKDSGIETISIRSFDNFYWLNEAMNKVFGDQSSIKS